MRCCPRSASSSLLVVLFSVFVEVWTGRLWFNVARLRRGLHHGAVDPDRSSSSCSGWCSPAVAVGNIMLAFRMRPILLGDGYRNPTVERYQDTVDPIRHWMLIGLGVVMFLFGGASAVGPVEDLPAVAQRRCRSARRTSTSAQDIGFFVFGYPWYRFLITFGFTRPDRRAARQRRRRTTCTAASGSGAKRDKIVARVRRSTCRCCSACSCWSRRSRTGWTATAWRCRTATSSPGITYTDANAVLPAKNILTIIALICAAALLRQRVPAGLDAARARVSACSSCRRS